jgi:hypothetical protein
MEPSMACVRSKAIPATRPDAADGVFRSSSLMRPGASTSSESTSEHAAVAARAKTAIVRFM